MISFLPPELARAAARESEGFAAAGLRAAWEGLSQAYRGNGGVPAILSPVQRAAYLVSRFPATFAAAQAAWHEAETALGGRRVESVLDAGAGPGTAALASTFENARVTLLERDAGWRAPALRLAEATGRRLTFLECALPGIATGEPHDVTVACYTLGELSGTARNAAVQALWKLTRLALIVIEPGTKAGYATVLEVRRMLIAAGASAAAPCPHDLACPMQDGDWCHRPVRLPRSRAHRAAKSGTLGFEDEKFSFVVMTRGAQPARAAARIVRRPIRNEGHVHLDLCTKQGIVRETVARSDRERYRAAREAEWGQAWTPKIK